MKQAIQQRDAYSLHLEIQPIGDQHYVRFQTVYDLAKMPNDPYTKLEMFLSDYELRSLAASISKYIDNGGWHDHSD